jgi:hypothetical protein
VIYSSNEAKDDDLDAIIRAVEDGVTDREFWHSRTPQERIWAAVLMRRRKYGEVVDRPIERVMEIVTRRRYAENDPDDQP